MRELRLRWKCRCGCAETCCRPNYVALVVTGVLMWVLANGSMLAAMRSSACGLTVPFSSTDVVDDGALALFADLRSYVSPNQVALGDDVCAVDN